MTNSYECFSTYHVPLADGLPYRQLFLYIQRTPNEYRKTLRRSICLEMLRAVSVTRSSQLKIT